MKQVVILLLDVFALLTDSGDRPLQAQVLGLLDAT
jgi:hypothetical protein